MKFVYLVLLCILASMTVIESRRRSRRYRSEWGLLKKLGKKVLKAGKKVYKFAKQNKDTIMKIGGLVKDMVAPPDAQPAAPVPDAPPTLLDDAPAAAETPSGRRRRRRYHH